MMTLQGKGIIKGKATGRAMITRMPVNFTAAFTKPVNIILTWLTSQVNDRHHELYKKLIKNTIFVYPATIGSTGTGMVLLELIYRNQAPAGIIVQNADTLMVSAPILADIWFGKNVPVVEYPGEDIHALIKGGARIEIDGTSGLITIK